MSPLAVVTKHPLWAAAGGTSGELNDQTTPSRMTPTAGFSIRIQACCVTGFTLRTIASLINGPPEGGPHMTSQEADDGGVAAQSPCRNLQESPTIPPFSCGASDSSMPTYLFGRFLLDASERTLL